MRHPSVPMCAIAFALALAACSSDESTTAPNGSMPSPQPLSPPSTTTATATGATGSPVPSPQTDVHLPNGMSAVVDDQADVVAISAGDLTPLVPAGSTPAASAALATPDAPIDQIAVSWQGGEPPPGRSGLIVWQRAGNEQAWRAVYAFTNPAARGVFGVRMDQADLTADGIEDLLTFEDVGGSGACGTYRVVASAAGDATEIFRRDVCDTQIQIAGGNLRIHQAVFAPSDPHCCPSAFRTTILRWDGDRWERVSSGVSPVPGSV